MSNICLALLLVLLIAGCQHSAENNQKAIVFAASAQPEDNAPAPISMLQGRELFDARNPPIYKSRIIRLPDSEEEAAIKILAGNNFCHATPEIIKQLLGGCEPDTQRMLEAQTAAALSYAKRRRSEAANPDFGDARRWMNAEAEAHEALAQYTKELSPNLHAYLIETKVYSEYTGGYSITLKGDELDVNHDSLGGPPLPWSLAILVFVEREIKHVTVSASTAE